MLVGLQKKNLMAVKTIRRVGGALHLHPIMARNGYMKNGANLKNGWIQKIEVRLFVLNVDVVKRRLQTRQQTRLQTRLQTPSPLPPKPRVHPQVQVVATLH